VEFRINHISKSFKDEENVNEQLFNESNLCFISFLIQESLCIFFWFRHVVANEVKCKGQQEDMISLSTSNGCSGEKGALGIPASSSLTDGGVCIPQGSPPNTLVRNVSTSDSSNIHRNGSSSPDVLQKNILSGPVDGWKDGTVANQQSRSMDKSTETGNAALLYFEAMLGTLKRTKENIGRATRIAIDCAKLGFATKVISFFNPYFLPYAYL
jgi:hypothetical protein